MPVQLGRSSGGEGVQPGLEELGDRPRQVLGGPGFGGRDQAGPHSLGLPLNVGEHLVGGGFLPAFGRLFGDVAIAVAGLGEAGGRSVADTLGPALPVRGTIFVYPGVAPSGEPDPLALDDLGPRLQGRHDESGRALSSGGRE